MNAQCLFSNREQRFQCECNQGYFGDGKSCYRTEQGLIIQHKHKWQASLFKKKKNHLKKFQA